MGSALQMRQNSGRQTGGNPGGQSDHGTMPVDNGFSGDHEGSFSKTRIGLTVLLGTGVLAGAVVGCYEWYTHDPITFLWIGIPVVSIFLVYFAFCCLMMNSR